MTKTTIFSLNTVIPSTDIRTISYDSNQTLLDADVILLTPPKQALFSARVVNGTPELDNEKSIKVKQQRDHWNSEIHAAATNGKLVIVFLEEPVRAVLTDAKGYFDSEIGSYDILPAIRKYSTITGTRMKPTNAAAIIQTYWKEFSHISAYRVAIEGRFSDILLESEVGNRVVGAINRDASGGAILYLPIVDFRTESYFLRGGKQWTKAGLQAGNRFVSEIARLADIIVGNAVKTPPPDWASGDKYRISVESDIQKQIDGVDKEIGKLRGQKSAFEEELASVAEPRRLLFEKGKALEEAIVDGLRSMGFQAAGFDDGESEFDAVFSSPEGERFIGEAEGRDNKAISIDKFSQLERNLNEDFAREDVEEFAKGILFGNAYRLSAPQDRQEAFTEKCLKAARRTGCALIRTYDMFAPIRYLKTHPEDKDYARACREAILKSGGDIVRFPAPPAANDE